MDEKLLRVPIFYHDITNIYILSPFLISRATTSLSPSQTQLGPD